MKKISLKIFVCLFFVTQIAICRSTEPPDTIRLFYLGGQSNMDGFGYNADLPGDLNRQFENVWIFHGNPVGDDMEGGGLGIWEPLKPGHGAGFWSNGDTNGLSDRFGVELSFAKRLQELYPGEKIAIIKYSRGGTSIDSLAAGRFGCWEPDYRGSTGINQYDHFLATLRNAMAVKDINSDGKEDYLVPCGIIWMQGESDAFWTEDIAGRYYLNLKRLMDLERAALLVDDLPVVTGKISDSGNDKDGKVWAQCELVQFAQEKYARTDGNAVIIRNTGNYEYSDPYHYNSAGYIDLGIRFADAVYGLIK